MAETIISPGVFQRENDISFISPAPVEVGACIIGPTVKGPVEIPTTVTSYNAYKRIFGETFDSGSVASAKSEYLTSIAAKNYFSQGGNTLLVQRVVTGSYTAADNTYISSSVDSGSNNVNQQPFTLKTIGKGTIYNSAGAQVIPDTDFNSDNSIISGSEDNLRWEISNVSSAKGTFTLAVRRGDDNHAQKVVLETYNNLSLDPNSSDYIAKRIGDQVSSLSGGQITVTGDHPNVSKYIRVANVALKTNNYLKTDGVTINSASVGFNVAYGLTAPTGFDNFLPSAGSGSFYNATGGLSAIVKTFNRIDANNQGVMGRDYTNSITLLENKDNYKFNIITAPGINSTDHSDTVGSLISLAETRGDCIAVIDLDGYGSAVSTQTTKAAARNSSYAASYYPWVKTISATGADVWCPPSTFVPGVYAFTDNSSAPWFAPAGLVRGGIAGITGIEKKLAKADRDTLYDGKVNPIASFPGTGFTIFGQKTLQTKSSALDRVNVRRLLIELKEFIGNQATNLVFEQNTIQTRNSFLSAVNPYLERVVQRQGLFSFRVVMDDTNNTADVVDRNQLIGQIFIQPAKTAEYIVLDFVVEPTGATFN